MKRVLLRRRLFLPSRSLSLRRVISGSSSSISNEAAGNLSDAHNSELYPGVPLFDLVRGWTLYNMFRCDYVVDNSIQVKIWMLFINDSVGQDAVAKVKVVIIVDTEIHGGHSWEATDREHTEG